jgi:outer membrane protein assembly factor BamB
MTKLTEKETDILKVISMIAGIFTMIVALTMIFSFIQLKTIDPLDNPAFVSVKEQYDKDPENALNAENVRAMDLMARKAYFASRRQVETGSYLLLAGAIVFILCRHLLAGNEKVAPSIPGTKPDHTANQTRNRKYLLSTASLLAVSAVVISFILRSNLPDLRAASEVKGDIENSEATGKNKASKFSKADKKSKTAVLPDEFKPDGTNYPFFRGQDGRAIAGGSGYPEEWNGETGTNIRWKIQVPKKGKSSPVIWRNKLFITGGEGLQGEVYCIDKSSGKILWTASASGIPGEPSELPEMDAEAGLAVSSAAVNANAVCAIFANGNLVCLDHDGNKKWALNVGSLNNVYGYSCSLIIYENTLIVQHDSDQRLSMMGFDINTGEMIWETSRSGHPVWSSPVIGIFNGKPQVVINGNPAVTAFDPVDGKELWSVDCLSGDVAPSLAVNGTMVYAVTDYQKLAAIKPGTGASIVWEDNTYTSDVSSPVANNEILVIATGYGDVACYNARLGDTLWTHYFMEQFYASPVIADGNIYLLDRSGTMHVVKAESDFELIAVSPLGEPADCTPAFSDKSIYIRARNNLYCISQN